MIKLITTDLQKIEDLHYSACHEYVESILTFSKEFLDCARLARATTKVTRNWRKNWGAEIATLKLAVRPFYIGGKCDADDIREVLSGTPTKLEPNLRSLYNDIVGLLETLLDNATMKILLSGNPEAMIAKSEEITLSHKIIQNPAVITMIEEAFSYEMLTDKDGFFSKGQKWDAYELASRLNISVCPYCNRNYIYTVFTEKGERVFRADLDHFFSKTDFPLLRLSFYNLIPSCQLCNSRLKKIARFSLATHIHPFLDGFGEDAYFRFEAKTVNSAMGNSRDPDAIAVILTILGNSTKTTKIENHNSVFQLENIYSKHIDIIKEMISKKNMFGEEYLNNLSRSFGLNLPLKDLYRLAFGNFYDEGEFQNRPLAKFTRDIARQLKFIPTNSPAP